MRRGNAINWRGIGRGQYKAGRLVEAEVSLRRSVELYEEYEDQEGVWIARGWLGLVLLGLGHKEEARSLLDRVKGFLLPLPLSRQKTLGSETPLLIAEIGQV